MTPTERHWDYICLTVLTIETAALAAAFLIPGTDENASRTTGLTESLSAVLKWLISAAYGIAVLRASMTLIAPEEPDKARRIQRKKEGTKWVVGTLWTMAFMLGCLAFISTILPPLQELATEIQQEKQGGSTPGETDSTPQQKTQAPEEPPRTGPDTPPVEQMPTREEPEPHEGIQEADPPEGSPPLKSGEQNKNNRDGR